MAKRTRPKQLAAFLDNYRAATLLILAALFSVSTIGQTIPQVNNVPWYEFAKKLSAGKVMLKQSGTYDTSFTIPYITASVVLDTITADRTVTFPNDSATTGKGVVILVWNVNNSEHTWNVSGNVLESHDGSDIDTLGRGGHLFYWTGAYWSRLAASGGGGVTLGSDFYIQNGPSSINLKTLGYEVNDSTLGIKSIGIVAGTGVTIDTAVGTDSIRWTINASAAAALDDLTDVVITDPEADQYLKFDGTDWVNATPTQVYPIRVADSIHLTNGIDTTDGAFVGGAGWSLNGNTVGSEKWLGTVDNFALPFRTNNTERGRITNGGKFWWNQSSATTADYGFTVADTLDAKGIRILGTTSQTFTSVAQGMNAQLGIRSAGNTSSDWLINAVNNSGTTLFSVRGDGSILMPNVFLSLSSTALRFASAPVSLQVTNASGSTTGNLLLLSPVNSTTNTNSGSAYAVVTSGTFAPLVTVSTSNIYAWLRVAGTFDHSASPTNATAVGLLVNNTLTSVPEGKYKAIDVTTGPSEFTAVQYAIANKTAAYTVGENDYTITADATGGAFTVTLQSAVTCAGREYVIKKTDASANVVTIGTTSSQTIDGSTTYTGLSAQYKYVRVQSNGTNWIIIGNN